MNRTSLAILIVLLVGTLLPACGASDSDSSGDDDTLYQVATLDGLSKGEFDGVMSFGDLEDHGNFGLGTFDALNGEMVAVDGDFYQIKDDGVAYEVDDDETTPFSAVTFFEADYEASLDEVLSCKDLEARIDDMLASEFDDADSRPFAIEVTSQFGSVLTRSESAQEQPYPTLEDALADQIEFNLTDVEGTLAGFRLPDYMGGANAAGYHFHFITEDRKTGGHALDCQTADAEIAVDLIDDWQVSLHN